jgi:PAS domain-containing protein
MPLVVSAKVEDILPGEMPDQTKPLQPLQTPIPMTMGQTKNLSNSVLSQTLPYNQEPLFYSEHAGSEFSSLNDFLSMIDDPDLVNGALNEEGATGDQILNFGFNNGVITNTNFTETTNGDSATNPGIQRNGNNSSNALNNLLAFSPNTNMFPPSFPNDNNYQMQRPQQPAQQTNSNQVIKAGSPSVGTQMGNSTTSTGQNPPLISDSARDKFFLTAADPTTEISPEERLKQVIKAKLEAGLLQPYNYAKGYARLQSYMDNYMNVSSRQRILKPLSIFRPAFRAIARTLKDVDLVLVEESFERMLLDYDRVFTSMAIPACLWRRTGEIYRGNKEFASLVGVKADDLKDGKLAIYELMSEESAVNFWEKYGAIAFDKGQKAVLTSCNLRTRDGIKRKSCCFSFTIRRDRYNIPSCIVGNFIPIDP